MYTMHGVNGTVVADVSNTTDEVVVRKALKDKLGMDVSSADIWGIYDA
jgi:hypothetical protein